MSHRRLLAPLAIAGSLLVVSACASDPSPNPTPSTSPPSVTSSPTTSSPSATATPDPTLPVLGEAFEERSWGREIGEVRGEARTPVVAGRHLVIVEDGVVTALEPQRGTQVWTKDWTPFEQSTPERDYPVLRQVSPDVVALVDVGKNPGDMTYRAAVTLFNIEDGKVIEEVTVEGTTSDTPVLGQLGLGFWVPQGTPKVVLPDGTVQDAPAVPGKTVDGAVTVGGTPVSLWNSRKGEGAPEKRPGFAGEDWTSQEITPNPDYTRADLLGGSVENLIVGRWSQPSTSVSGPATKQAVQVVRVDTGRVTATLPCVPEAQDISLSPDRSRGVVGSIRLDRAGNGECEGEEERGTTSTFTAVTNEGRAFGTAQGPGSPKVFVELGPDGRTKRHDLPEGVNPPIGVLAGNVAVHWDQDSGVVTGNPIKD